MMSQLQISPQQQRTIQQLRGRIRKAETSSRNDDGTLISSGCKAMDLILPCQGYNRGTIIEWFSEHGSCADFFSLLTARHAAADGGAIVIVDPHDQFYPPAARAIGINLSNLIVLRNATDRNPHSTDFLWAIDQSLRCSSVAAVWGELPEFETTQLAVHWQRRFQLSAESSGCCGLFVRRIRRGSKAPTGPFRQLGSDDLDPAFNAIRSSSWAEIQWHLKPLSNFTHSGETRHVRASLVRCRGGVAGKKVDLEINNITGNVQIAQREHAAGKLSATYSLPLATLLAHPKTHRRAERA